MLAAAEPARELGRLEEAAAIWRELRSPLGEARVALLAALLEDDAESARAAEERLQALGSRGYRTALSSLLPREAGQPLVVQSLGRFRVFRGGEPVPLAAWQSRKARDLLKILVARRGRPTAREYVMEMLWPEQSPARLGNRLSVLLSTVRTVLDPEKRFEADHFVAADRGSLWLQGENLVVDVERFLSAASAALASLREDNPSAPAELIAAEAAYSGDFLEEDAYEEWALPLREEARVVYTEVARALAEDLGPGRGGRRCHPLLPARARARSLRRARPPRPRRRARGRGAPRRGASPLPRLLLADGDDRRRVRLLPGRAGDHAAVTTSGCVSVA